VHGGAQGTATTKEGKQATIDKFSDLLGDTNLLFALEGSKLGPNERVKLRRSLPEGTKIHTVKNRLLRVAAKGTDFEDYANGATGQSLYVFVTHEDYKGVMEALKQFGKGMPDFREHNVIKGGSFDSTVLDAEGVDAISKLPTKLELIQKIAVLINMVPTRLATSVKQVPTKLARAINLALVDGKDGGGEGEGTAAEEPSAAADTPPADAAAAEGDKGESANAGATDS